MIIYVISAQKHSRGNPIKSCSNTFLPPPPKRYKTADAANSLLSAAYSHCSLEDTDSTVSTKCGVQRQLTLHIAK